MVVNEGGGELAEAALSEAVCAVLGDDLHPEVCLGVGAGHHAVHARNSGYLLMGSARRAWEFQPGRRAGVLGGVRGMLTDTALTDFIFMFFSPGQF